MRDESICTKLQRIKDYTSQRSISQAEHEFILLINETNPEWNQFCVSPNITKIFHYVRDVHIIPGKDVYVNLISQEVSFGAEFLLKDVKSPADLLFVVYHERNHVLVNKLYKTALFILLADMKRNHPKAPILRLARDAEEVFVNALSHCVIPNQNLLERIFPRSGAYVSLRTPHPDLNFWGAHHKILKLHHLLFTEGLSNCSFLDWVQIYITEILAHKTDVGEEVQGPFQPGDGSIMEDDEDEKSHPPVKPAKGSTQKGGKGLIQKEFPLDPSDPMDSILIDTSVSASRELNIYDIPEIEKTMIMHSFQRIFSTLTANINNYCIGRTSTVPSRVSRKDQQALRQGTIPPLFSRRYYPIVPIPKFYIYCDVSGSMDKYLVLLPIIYRRLAFLTKPELCYCFSTEIVEADPQFKIFLTTGGTSFSKVAEHIHAQKVKHAVVISDGCDYLTGEDEDKLKKQMEHLVYVHVGRSIKLDLSPWHLLSRQIKQHQTFAIANKDLK